MKKACLIVDKFYQKNKIFDMDNKVINRDNCLYFFYMLKEEFEKKGYDLSTEDINSIEESEIILYNEMPKISPKEEDIKKSHLLIFESELIKPQNWDFKKHKYFAKIFTWNDDFVDNKKYFKLNFTHKIQNNIDKDVSKKEKLCTLIAGNKKNNDPRELYSERVKAIEWFEENFLKDFDLYGIGWDLYYFGSPFGKLNRFKSIRKIFKNNYRSYNGKVDSKNEVLSKYKFSICYENAKDIPGYITEKIFDSFFAGCVPVYWGAPNITEFIPQECFIDKTKFDTYEELYNHLKYMSDDEYEGYLISIEKYLKSEKINQFSAEIFANEIVDEILEG